MTSSPSELDLLRAVLRTASRPAAAWRADGSLIGCSASFESLLDGQSDATPDQVVHPDDRAEVEKYLLAHAGGDLATATFRVRLMTKTGSVIRTMSRLMPLLVDGAVVGALFECVRWGDQLDAADTLGQQAANYERLLEQVDQVVFSVDDRAGLVTANRATERLLGRTVEEMRRTPGAEMFFPGDLQAVSEIRARFDAATASPRRSSSACDAPMARCAGPAALS